jgi:hypothetical protein
VFLGIDLANFYLNTPIADLEYMRLRLDIIPEEIIIKYNLRDLVMERYSHEGYLIKVVVMALAGEVARELSPIRSWSNNNYEI